MIESHQTRRAAVVRLSGEFDLAVVADLHAALDQAVAGDQPTVAIECAQISFMDIAGARPLAAARATAAQRGKEFVLLDPAPRVSYVLGVLGLGDAVLALEPPAWPLDRGTDQRPPPHLTPPGPPV